MLYSNYVLEHVSNVTLREKHWVMSVKATSHSTIFDIPTCPLRSIPFLSKGRHKCTLRATFPVASILKSLPIRSTRLVLKSFFITSSPKKYGDNFHWLRLLFVLATEHTLLRMFFNI